jgi:hypothetical protein
LSLLRWRGWHGWGLLAVSWLAAAVAHADAGDWVVGVAPSLSLALDRPPERAPGALLQLTADVGLSDLLMARVGVGPTWNAADGRLKADAQLGLLARWNVLRWVPVAEVHLGLDGPPRGLHYGGQLEVRRYANPRFSVAFGVGVERRADRFETGLRCGVYRDL